MNRYLSLVTLLALGLTACQTQSDHNSLAPYVSPQYAAAPFDMPAVATVNIPAYSVRLNDFGAKGDGGTLCTEAFAAAMKALDEKGGGHLIVPSGIWFTGPIQFVSNVDLHVEQGALVLFTTDYDAYPEVTTIYEGNTSTRKMAPLYAYEVNNIAITGASSLPASGARLLRAAELR